MKILLAIIAGGVFGFGMSLSGMTNPERVFGFFDVLGAWDPTLGFVMGGAVIPMAIAWRIRNRMPRAALGGQLPGPPSEVIDGRLIGGSATFGVGWGMVGLCPGAVVPALATGGWPVGLFFIAMLSGIALMRAYLSRTLVANA